MPDDVLAQYKVGEVIVWEAFSSTTTEEAVCFGGVKFEIHCSKALKHRIHGGMLQQEFLVPAEIHDLSQFKGEMEVLYPPYTTFRIVSKVTEAGRPLVVLETTELPSLFMLVAQGRWDEVQEGIQARHEGSTADSPAWFTQHEDASESLMSQVASKIEVEGGTSGGLAVVQQMHGLGANPTAAHEQLLQAGLGPETLKLPEAHPKWFFDASIKNDDDKQMSERVEVHDGLTWQRYYARESTLLEQWYTSGHEGELEFTVVNNLEEHTTYVVSYDAGCMWQKPLGNTMIGHLRQVLRQA